MSIVRGKQKGLWNSVLEMRLKRNWGQKARRKDWGSPSLHRPTSTRDLTQVRSHLQHGSKRHVRLFFIRFDIYMQGVKSTFGNLYILTLIDQSLTFLSQVSSAMVSALLIFIESAHVALMMKVRLLDKAANRKINLMGKSGCLSLHFDVLLLKKEYNLQS